jgi:S1-C subfamily serine protease
MAMKFPRHLWTGEWRLESEQAREAAEEEAARRRAALAAAERERAAAGGEPSGALPRTIRLKTVAAVALVAAAIAGGAFAAGALLHDDAKVAPLPAVSGKPVTPDKGRLSPAGKIYALASPAVVSIRTDVGSGTGFLIDRDGTLVTNAHVVGNADRVVVKFGPDGRSIDGEVKGSDPSSDLAVVKIDSGSAPRYA